MDPLYANLRQELGLDNLGGVEEFWYTPARNLVGFPERGPLTLATLALVAGACWYRIVPTRGTADYDQKPKQNGRHGDTFTQLLKGALPRHTPGLAEALERMQRERFVVLYRDLNGEVQLVGTPAFPLEWQDTYTAGSQTSRNGFTFQFSGETLRRARPFLGSWLVSNGGLLSAGPAGGTPQTPAPGTGVSNHEQLSGLQGGSGTEHWHVTQAMFEYLQDQLFQAPSFSLQVVATPAARATGYWKRGVDTITSVRVTLSAIQGSVGAVTASTVLVPPAAVQNFPGLMSPNPRSFAAALVATTIVSSSATFGPSEARANSTVLADSKTLEFVYATYYGTNTTGPVNMAALQELVAPFGGSRQLSFTQAVGERNVMYLPGTQLIRYIEDQNGFDATDSWTQTRVQLAQGTDAAVDYVQLVQNDYATVVNTASYTFSY